MFQPQPYSHLDVVYNGEGSSKIKIVVNFQMVILLFHV